MAHQLRQGLMRLLDALCDTDLAHLDPDRQCVDKQSERSIRALPAVHAAKQHRPKHYIIAGRRSITADTDLRLCRFFGLSEGWWLRLQSDHDTRRAKAALVKELARIKPLKETR